MGTRIKPGRKGRGHRSQAIPDPVTHHRCGVCGKKRLDPWGKVPRLKYGDGEAAHPYCAKAGG